MKYSDCYNCRYRILLPTDEPCCDCDYSSEFIMRDLKMNKCDKCKYANLSLKYEPCYSCMDFDSFEPCDDAVNRPSYYTDGNIEVIEYIEDKNLGFCLGNAVKYISRAGKKNPDKEIEDIEKAIWYLRRYIEQIGGDNND